MAEERKSTPRVPPRFLQDLEFVECVTDFARADDDEKLAAWAVKWAESLVHTLVVVLKEKAKLNLSHKFLGNAAQAGAQLVTGIRNLERDAKLGAKNFIPRPRVEKLTAAYGPLLISQWVMALASLSANTDAERAAFFEKKLRELFGEKAQVSEELKQPNVQIPKVELIN